ncbi:MAG TPA: histidinol-phosphate transaminase [Gaiellaceae bacterium]|nr:histidinol-phosphate transaminase [Gaiellaceae bacterium]
MARATAAAGSRFRPAVEDLVPYEPGKPIEELERELGLETIVKLASNEAPVGPFPAALEALARLSPGLNRYPDGGAFRLRAALAERHGVRFEEIAPGAGADGIVDGLSQALLDPGDDVVCGWPSFPSYVIDAMKMGAAARTVPLDGRLAHDLEAMLEAIGERTKLVYVCHPNNPTGTANGRDELAAFLARLPEHVLPVLDQAYFEYAQGPDYADAVEEHFKTGRRVVVLRTFSKIYALAGLRVGYAVAPADVVTALGKVRRAFDVTSAGQEAALASLGDIVEVERRRDENAKAMADLERILRRHGLEPAAGAAGNFLYVEVGEDARAFYERLLEHGVIVRPLAGFGAPGAVRVTAGTPKDHAVLDAALSAVVGGAAPR